MRTNLRACGSLLMLCIGSRVIAWLHWHSSETILGLPVARLDFRGGKRNIECSRATRLSVA